MSTQHSKIRFPGHAGFELTEDQERLQIHVLKPGEELDTAGFQPNNW